MRADLKDRRIPFHTAPGGRRLELTTAELLNVIDQDPPDVSMIDQRLAEMADCIVWLLGRLDAAEAERDAKDRVFGPFMGAMSQAAMVLMERPPRTDEALALLLKHYSEEERSSMRLLAELSNED